MTDYTITRITTPNGHLLAELDTFESLSYTRVVNAVTTLDMVIGGHALPWSYLRPDNRIEVWYSTDGINFYLDTDTTWIIRYPRKRISGRGARSYDVQAYCATTLIDGPIVAYAADSEYADKYGPLDDMMKHIIRENLGSLTTDSTREIANLIIEADQGNAPTDRKAFAWRNVLNTLQEIAQTSEQQGTPLFFDVVYEDKSFVFRTYTERRGLDHRWPGGVSPVQIGPEFGNLVDIEIGIDARNERNAVYCGGRGEEDSRNIVTLVDSDAVNSSTYARREQFVDARMYKPGVDITPEARAALEAGRRRTTFRGKLLDTENSRYGLHWRWGDELTATVDDDVIDCRADAVSVQIQNGRRTVETWLKGNVR
ncbi:MAG: hypothetical protein GFH27_549283n423 [Chloroflexi bacterium AL-W]|nr:hypothetical protein [Chloroflexi bacterium AL-N1]NOK64456.1 hypothetical protein [Chloroflexi bacterium AL-N10]NOK75698.1 hypothetical protein [Chloroflexi bacterium AL-N5]NOK80544.1 hypothetical protein [Chloroflexi bacterium AL-W]NOK87058.1 hypothetical protein [Chloroflexi bacterium AL-N15]